MDSKRDYEKCCGTSIFITQCADRRGWLRHELGDTRICGEEQSLFEGEGLLWPYILRRNETRPIDELNTTGTNGEMNFISKNEELKFESSNRKGQGPALTENYIFHAGLHVTLSKPNAFQPP